MKEKVYLSRASKVDPKIYALVKLELAKRNVEIIEATEPFTGHERMLDCDSLVLIPNKVRTDDVNFTQVGKGQAGQIDAWVNDGKDIEPIIVTTANPSTSTVKVGLVLERDYEGARTVRITDTNDYVNYGFVRDTKDDMDLSEIYEEPSNLGLISNSSTVTIHLGAAVHLGLI